jgi:hypothetical protein
VKKAIQTALLLIYAVIAISQTTRPAQGGNLRCDHQVTDELGAVIPKAMVVLHADMLERGSPKPFNLELRTSSEGEAKADLPSGFFDAFVASTGFMPHCEKLRMRNGRPAVLKFVLKVDKLISDEYGDRFVQPYSLVIY